ncbi:MAG: sensor histidine kinase [Candidatus Ornithomonoglobus sp.]
MFKSIFGRMFWTYAILLLLVLTTISLSMTMLLTKFNERKQVESIAAVAQTIEYWTSELQVAQTDAKSAQAYKRMLHAWSRLVSADITVINLDGNILESTCGISRIPDSIQDNLNEDYIALKKSDFGEFYDHEVLTISFPVHYKDNKIGTILFNLGLPELRRTVMELLFMFIMSSLIAITFAFVIVYIQAKKISAPIVSINNAARKIAAGNFSERVQVTTNDEIGQLASTFNFMASSIEKSERNRQRFVSDVSHELRTPMTSISGFVQGMLDGTISDEDRDDYLKIVLDESTRLTKLVNDMLEMSKMQSDEFKLDITPFDINELICTCLISLEKRIDDKGLDVNVDFRPDRLVTLGDKYQIQRVIINLLDNAVKFSHTGTTININTWIAAGKAHISVSDTGDVVKDSDLKHLFDRFYKTDMSREKDRTGAGLGLSLVQNIIRLHNQTITASCVPDQNGESGVTTFEFTLEVK